MLFFFLPQGLFKEGPSLVLLFLSATSLIWLCWAGTMRKWGLLLRGKCITIHGEREKNVVQQKVAAASLRWV